MPCDGRVHYASYTFHTPRHGREQITSDSFHQRLPLQAFVRVEPPEVLFAIEIECWSQELPLNEPVGDKGGDLLGTYEIPAAVSN